MQNLVTFASSKGASTSSRTHIGAPICVLDEVDAPLDDANVTRFCNLLTELTKITSTRFIIVTHHALTMSKMDRLYGVTMPEKGISQLVAVDLQKAESMVA